jgi:S-methylmethionine-dependent homocysteine/selenocysteine methylase
MMLTGNRQLATAMQSWLGLSPFAKEQSYLGFQHEGASIVGGCCGTS